MNEPYGKAPALVSNSCMANPQGSYIGIEVTKSPIE